MIRMVVANVIMVMVITIVIIIFKIMVGSPWCRNRGRSRRRSTGRRWQTFLKRFRIKTRRRSINSFIQRLTSVLSQASYSQELWRLWESSEGVEHTWIFLVRPFLMAGSYHIRVIFMYAVNQRWWEYLQWLKCHDNRPAEDGPTSIVKGQGFLQRIFVLQRLIFKFLCLESGWRCVNHHIITVTT